MSWYPPEFSDGQMESNPGFSDAALQSLLDIAHKYDMKGKKERKKEKEMNDCHPSLSIHHHHHHHHNIIKDSGYIYINLLLFYSLFTPTVNLHVEPYPQRSEGTLGRDIRYVIGRVALSPPAIKAICIMYNVCVHMANHSLLSLSLLPDHYGSHPALYRYPKNNLPMYTHTHHHHHPSSSLVVCAFMCADLLWGVVITKCSRFYVYDSYHTPPTSWVRLLGDPKMHRYRSMQLSLSLFYIYIYRHTYIHHVISITCLLFVI